MVTSAVDIKWDAVFLQVGAVRVVTKIEGCV